MPETLIEQNSKHMGVIEVTSGGNVGNGFIYEGYNTNTLTLNANGGIANDTVMNIFDEMMTDDKVNQAISIVDSNVTNLDHYIECEDSSVRMFLNNALEHMDIRRYKSDALKARQKGFSLFEEIWETVGGRWYIAREKYIPPNRVRFETDSIGKLTALLINGNDGKDADKFVNTDWFHLFTYPEIDVYSLYYGRSDLITVYRNWYTKKILTKYRNLGLENFAFPTVICVYDTAMFPEGSPQLSSLQTAINGIKDDARILIAGRRMGTSTEIMPGAMLTFLQPNFAGGGFDALQTAIDSENKAITRALGLPDDLGYTDTTNGSLAKAKEESTIFWERVKSIAAVLENDIQVIINRLLERNYGAVYPKAAFRFDTVSDKGLTQDKVNVLKGLREAGIQPSTKFIAGYTGIPETDIELVEVKAEAAGQPNLLGFSRLSNDKFTRQLTRYESVVNFARIEKTLNRFDDEYTPAIAEAINDGVQKWIKKVQSSTLGIQSVTIDGFDGTAKSKLKKIFQTAFLDAYFSGKGEALSEVEKKQGGMDALDYGFKGQIETFAAESPNVGDWVSQWAKDHNIDVNKLDKEYLKKLTDPMNSYPFRSVADITERVSKIFRSAMMGSYADAGADAIVRQIMSEMEAQGLTIVRPDYIRTSVRTTTGQFYNMGRMNMFNDPALSQYITAYQYSSVIDDRTSEFCLLHDGEIIAANDPRLPSISGVCHFNCRKILVPITRYDDYETDYGTKPGLTAEEAVKYAQPAAGFGGV